MRRRAASPIRCKRYRVKIPAGVREGSRIRLAGKGEPGLGGGPPGDLYVVTHVAPSPVFKRRGDHLEVEVPITIVEAVRGGTVEVPTLDGTKKIRVPAGHRRTAASSACAARGRRSFPARDAATSATASASQIPKSLTKEQQEAFDRVVRGHERQPARGAARPGAEGGLMAERALRPSSRACS